uniref:Eukaryotic translation initiation factor 2D n=1 Tax=Scleropages formosus TaxID=113540 RepID=A0A8C9VCS2_SCLFO
MFAKPFRVKSNTVMKGSDRRKLRADVSAAFPALSGDDVSALVPSKEELNVVKAYAHRGDAVTLYVLHKNPVFFEVEKHIYPTVYTLWRYPDTLPAFTTWPTVLQKLAGGADLMLPGVVVPSQGLPEVKQGDCCAITVVRNRAPVAVGTATMSTGEMQGLGMKGRGVSILHAYMDSLWAFGDKSGPPSIPAPHSEDCAEEECSGEGDVPEEAAPGPDGDSTTDTCCPDLQELSLNQGETEQGEEHGNEDGGTEEEKSPQGEEGPANFTCMVSTHWTKFCFPPTEQMDILLLQCFLHALKSKVKKSELPLLTSTFLRNHMFSCCPSGKQLDIKKSSYKKLSKFLHSMQQQHHLVEIKELSKGVESIVDVAWKHPELRSFCPPEESVSEEAPVDGSGDHDRPYHPPEITPLYVVSARLEPLFQDSQKRYGLNGVIVNLPFSFININPALCDCLLEKSEYQEVEKLKWDDLFTRTMDKMQHSYKLLFPGQEPIIKKGQIEPINISVASRGSNKKVTLIKNLELYGIDPAAMATTLQHRVQASTVLNPVPGSKDRVLVQIQGNQVQQVGSILLDQYQIPRKYIQGLEKGQKPGKKK